MANSSFRMHLAYLPVAEQRKILGQHQPALTPNTMTEPEKIIERMAGEKAEGLAYDMEEQDLGVCAVSAPVLERDGSLKAVLTVVAPRSASARREKTAEGRGAEGRRGRIDGVLERAAQSGLTRGERGEIVESRA